MLSDVGEVLLQKSCSLKAATAAKKLQPFGQYYFVFKK
jgi:hypothetical protein